MEIRYLNDYIAHPGSLKVQSRMFLPPKVSMYSIRLQNLCHVFYPSIQTCISMALRLIL